jgi:hypothetical protein
MAKRASAASSKASGTGLGLAFEREQQAGVAFQIGPLRLPRLTRFGQYGVPPIRRPLLRLDSR